MEEKIKASELRLGNYIYGNYIEETENADIEEKCICSVNLIDGVGCTEYKIWASSIEEKGKLIEEWDSFAGIPLTEQWLLNFNFKYHKTGEFWSNDGFKVWEFEGGFYHVNNETLTYFDNVHHLQNYYFFATYLNGIGKELTLKEKTTTINNIKK